MKSLLVPHSQSISQLFSFESFEHNVDYEISDSFGSGKSSTLVFVLILEKNKTSQILEKT